MLRRTFPSRIAAKLPFGPALPVYEVLYKKFASSQFDSRSATAGKALAVLHKNHIHTLGEWKDASAEARTAITESGPQGAAVVKLLDEALAQAGVGCTGGAAEAAANMASGAGGDSNAPKVLIAYGSQTGTAEGLARQAGLMAKSSAGVNPVVVSLNDAAALLSSPSCPKFAAMLVLCSTYGTGEFSTNSQGFYKALKAGALTASLKSIPHSVFGLGNSHNTDNFNMAAKLLVKELAAVGSPSLGKPVYSCELAEEGHDAAFRSWKSTVWSTLGERGIGNGGTGSGVADIYSVATIYGLPAERLERKGWIHANVVMNEVKSVRNYEPSYRHMVVDVPLRESIHILGRKLVATDQLVVHPHNKKAQVGRALELFGLNGEEIVEVSPLPGAPSSFFDGHKITTRTLFREVIDLSGVPARSTLSLLAFAAQDPRERAAIDALANDLSSTSEYSKLTSSGKVLTVLDVLERFKSIKLTLAQAVSRLPHIKSRYYSNAHDPESKLSNEFHVVYNVPTRNDAGRVHKGLATSNMESCTPAASSLWVTLEAGKTTMPPVDAPALLIGLGSGIGLVMAALEQRATAKAAGKAVGPAMVIYGFRQTGKDQIYKDELEAYVKSGVVTTLKFVGSYDTPGQFVSPFDQIDKAATDKFVGANGHVLYCGVGGSVPALLGNAFRRLGVSATELRNSGRYHEEYFTTDLDHENLLKNASAAAQPGTLAAKFGDCSMFCMQCEQTFKGQGCFKQGVCGKTPTTSALQDLLVHYVKVLGFYLDGARKLGAVEDAAANRLCLFALFTTLTNVNFDDKAILATTKEVHAAIAAAKAAYEAAAKAKGAAAAGLPKDCMAIPATFSNDIAECVEAGRTVGVLTRFVDAGAKQDAASLCEILLYGIKGLAAYTDHSLQAGKERTEIYAYMQKALSFLTSEDRHDIGKALEMCLECGKVNVTAMGLLYETNSSLGVPSPATAVVKPKPGKAILFSGHDLILLRDLLPLCDKEGINVYTHGEMLPAHSYPELRKHKSLAGHFGGAWMRQSIEFAHFPGAICMSTNCLTEPHESYGSRLFTCGAVGWTGIKHLGKSPSDINFAPLIAAAKAAPGFAADCTEFTYPDPIGVTKRPASHAVGFGHETILSVAPTVIEGINKGLITRFYVIGGCDGYEGQRHYYAELAKALPKTSVVLTVGCGKFRLLPLAEELGTIGDTGIPRLLDVGQCNDSFSCVQVALALASVLKCQVSDLPLSIVLSWLEQKAVAVLLSCLALGLKPIRIGPSLPAFVTPTVLKVLVENFGVLPVGNPEADAAAMVAAKGMIEGKK